MRLDIVTSNGSEPTSSREYYIFRVTYDEHNSPELVLYFKSPQDPGPGVMRINPSDNHALQRYISDLMKKLQVES